MKTDPILGDVAGLCLALTQHAPLPMATVDGATHVVRYGNPAFCSLMEKPIEQLVGKPLYELLPEKDECVTLLDRVFQTRKPESYTEQEEGKPHPVFWSYTMWPMLTDELLVGIIIQVTETAVAHGKTVAMNQALMLGSVRQHELTEAAEKSNEQLRLEIAERKKAEEALKLAKEQLADHTVHLERLVAERTAELSATNKQLEAFVYSVAHDLRAPLRSMQGFSQILMEEAGTSLSETCRHCATRISGSAEYMDELLLDLLAFSQIAQHKIQLSEVNLGIVIQSILARAEKEIQEKKARVEISGPWPSVLAHEPTLGQVVFNLVNNALKFGREGAPPQIRIQVEERTEGMDELIEGGTKKGQHPSQPPSPASTNPTLHSSNPPLPPVTWVRVWVEDNGIGIAPSHREQIFGLFTRLHGDEFPGTGVGLAIVQKGMERMGGKVGVESTFGQGSRFWIELRKAPGNGTKA